MCSSIPRQGEVDKDRRRQAAEMIAGWSHIGQVARVAGLTTKQVMREFAREFELREAMIEWGLAQEVYPKALAGDLDAIGQIRALKEFQAPGEWPLPWRIKWH